MGRAALTKPFAWGRYSKKLTQRIDKARWSGTFVAEDATDRGMRFVTGEAGDMRHGNLVRLHWLVDETDGVIADAKFQVFGQSALIGAADAGSELVMSKSYVQASRISADLIDRHLRDRNDMPSFPFEASGHLNLVIDAMDEAVQQCSDIKLSDTIMTPLPPDIEVREGGYPGFNEMDKANKLALIEQVVADDIRPYIELDAGGITLVDIINGRELIIAYSGACTTCHSATGMTLSYVQQMLRAKVHPELVVIPDLATTPQ